MSASKPTFTIDLALLGLFRQGPLHPYELFQQLQQPDGLGSVWRLKQSHLYALLDRLEARRYLTHRLELQGHRPPRKVLSLTPAGEAAFAEWVVTPVSHGRDIRLEFLTKLYFARREGPVVAAQLLERQIGCCQRWLDKHTQRGEALPEQSFERLVQQYRVGQIRATLAWLEECQETLAVFGV
ncbi:PadR family transcriptional regulator [Chloroflexus aggregans]|uniref:Transcriptional regulator, PadR-like family n=1 Tax=Chloroflexus aggregans (strain MD-66 / DSM 9485) TaxID=326427 RepID=B8G8L6_CHLAD|nr:PadR family transcriptional regulator [Chloroflexus aggregans]ACL24278.1 transcriptional regulator, PadR-like family [Chloroflexus aggregans DSM 9485]